MMSCCFITPLSPPPVSFGDKLPPLKYGVEIYFHRFRQIRLIRVYLLALSLKSKVPCIWFLLSQFFDVCSQSPKGSQVEELRKPVDVLRTGGQDVNASFSHGFNRSMENEAQAESLLTKFVTGMPELREEATQPQKAETAKANGYGKEKRRSIVLPRNGVASKSPKRVAPPSTEFRKIGRYVIEQEIGKGACGSVYRARDPKLDRPVAIKTVRYRFGQPGSDIIALKEKLYHEARAIAKLNHPNIVVIHDVDEDHDLCFIVMEYLDGMDLRSMLDKEHRVEWDRAVPLMIQACNALHYAHSLGIVHLDIKPSNLVLQRHHNNLKLTDFSIDKSTLRPPVSNNSESGAHLYLAPEQRNGGAVDCRTDIFSLGVVFYEMLTGETPCLDENIVTVTQSIAKKSYVPPSLQNIELPVEVDDVVAGALFLNPQQRYRSAEEFRDALVRLQTSVLLI